VNSVFIFPPQEYLGPKTFTVLSPISSTILYPSTNSSKHPSQQSSTVGPLAHHTWLKLPHTLLLNRVNRHCCIGLDENVRTLFTIFAMDIEQDENLVFSKILLRRVCHSLTREVPKSVASGRGPPYDRHQLERQRKARRTYMISAPKDKQQRGKE
jgi:hypothetical protein